MGFFIFVFFCYSFLLVDIEWFGCLNKGVYMGRGRGKVEKSEENMYYLDKNVYII